MTKSPAKATDAHISVIGHITTDELRRSLTRTEAANGFANRLCELLGAVGESRADEEEWHRDDDPKNRYYKNPPKGRKGNCYEPDCRQEHKNWDGKHEANQKIDGSQVQSPSGAA